MTPVYADYNATYPCSESHLDLVHKVMKKTQGNPSSIHQQGREARLVLEESRSPIGKLLGVPREQICFTSGATEANNLALQGVVARRQREGQPKPHVVLSAGEHPSLLQPALWLQERGQIELSLIPLNMTGQVNTGELLRKLRPDTCFTGLIYGNNETGAINPLQSLAALIREKAPAAHIHCDGVQAFGKIDCSWTGESELNSFAASAHKVGGFKGTGCLYIRSGADPDPMMIGGGQEHKQRSGTENMPGVISFGLRAREILSNPDWQKPAAVARDALIQELLSLAHVSIHGDYENPENCLSNTVNFHLRGVEGATLMLNFDLAGISVSSGSACSSGIGAPSPVLLAMGHTEEVALNSVRVSFGDRSTIQDVQAIVSVVRESRPS